MTAARRILLADDDPLMRELAESKLRDAGYQVRACVDGAEALAQLKCEGADLVISDLDMPNMNGFELTRNIREDRAICDTPVIVVTASDEDDPVERAFAAGATSFLAKPINWTLFHQSVKFVLRVSEDQRALREARDQAEAGARFKDSLMSVMSHELRTPLNAIIGFGQLIGDAFERQKDPLYKEYAEYIVEGGRRLLNSVSDMLLASDARSGPIAINETESTIASVVEDALSIHEKAIETSKCKIIEKYHDREAEIRCDRALLSRALAKLVENSIKFSPQGVRVTIATVLTPNGEMAILVSDNGPGIAADKLKSIMSPFAQSDMSMRRTKEGLGLGIPLVQSIAQAHDAIFKLDSKESCGAQALIVLPGSRVIQQSRSRTDVA